MRKTVYRLKKFRLNEVSLVDRPACDIATLERIELIKRRDGLDAPPPLNTSPAQENHPMTSEELDALPDSAFAYIEPGGSKDATGKTVPRSLRHFPIQDPAHVRNALARVKQSKFGANALPAILAAAKKFGIDVASDPYDNAAADNDDQAPNSGPESETGSPVYSDPDTSMSKSGSGVDLILAAAVDLQKRGAALSAASRGNLHQARDILVKMCANAGCGQDRALSAYLDNPANVPLAASPGNAPAPASGVAAGPSPSAELGKLLDDLRRAAGTLGAAADEVRKIAEASAGSIRKSEGSAKVLTALAERVTRLEAQPDTSRPQPLRAVEKGILIESAATAADDIRLRITRLQSEAAELRKRGGDVAAQKRLSEIGVEIIRLSNGAY